MKHIWITLRAVDNTFQLAALDVQSDYVVSASGEVFEDALQRLVSQLGVTAEELEDNCMLALSDGEDDALVDKAIRLLLMKHKGQVDKAGMDYRLHPLRVAMGVDDVDAKVVALLHDVIEDTGTTPEELAKVGFPQDIIDGIVSVTRREGEGYKDFVVRAAKNNLGHQVKLSDIKDNLNLLRLPKIEATDAVRLNKYLQCYRFLTTGNTSYLNLIS